MSRRGGGPGPYYGRGPDRYGRRPGSYGPHLDPYGRPLRKGRRHSPKVYRRRRIFALVVSVLVVFVGLVVIVNIAHALTGSSGHPSASKSKSKKSDQPLKTVTTTLPPAAAGVNNVTVSAVGEVSLGAPSGGLPPIPNEYFSGVNTALPAPIVFGDLDGALTSGGVSKCAANATNCYAFRAPPSYATYLKKAGFKVMSLANNHSYDFGQQGVDDTTSALKKADIVSTGLPGQIAVVSDQQTKVAFVAFAPYPQTNNLLDQAAANVLIQKAHTMAPVVIVYMHAGAEGAGADHVTGKTETENGQDVGNPEAFAHAAINDGAAAVIGSGTQVLRGIQFYKGHIIDYSLGNFATYDDFTTQGDLNLSGIIKMTLSPSGQFVSASWVSCLLNAQGQPIVDKDGAAASFVNQLSATDFGASAGVIQPNGSIVQATTPTTPASSTTATTS